MHKVLPSVPIYLLRSFLEISSSVLSKNQAEEAISAMLHAGGFDNKDHITWEDFHLLLQDHENVLQFAQLSIQGVFLFLFHFTITEAYCAQSLLHSGENMFKCLQTTFINYSSTVPSVYAINLFPSCFLIWCLSPLLSTISF